MKEQIKFCWETTPDQQSGQSETYKTPPSWFQVWCPNNLATLSEPQVVCT